MAGMLTTLRVALFGATRPVRWLRDALRTGAEELDPQRADPRSVLQKPYLQEHELPEDRREPHD
jgi:hypothetical protein